MKKSKLSITLVTSFIAAMALSACKDVTKSDDAIVTFKPYKSDSEISLITNDVYNKYRGTSNGVSMFYEKILEVLIRWEFKNGFSKGDMKLDEIEKYADNQVKEQKDKAIAAMKPVTSVIDSLLFFIFNSPFSNNSAIIINNL